MRLIGLGGYAEAGKDAVADVLVDLGWRKTYMSKPLEQALLTLDPVIVPNETDSVDLLGDIAYSYGGIRYSVVHAILGYEGSKKLPEVRRLLQVLGTEVGRNMFGQDVWVNIVFAEVDALRTDGFSVAITGIRYTNELAALHLRRGQAVWVDRGGEPVNAHSSDNTLGPGDFDDVIDNLGDLDALHDEVVGWVSG